MIVNLKSNYFRFEHIEDCIDFIISVFLIIFEFEDIFNKIKKLSNHQF